MRSQQEASDISEDANRRSYLLRNLGGLLKAAEQSHLSQIHCSAYCLADSQFRMPSSPGVIKRFKEKLKDKLLDVSSRSLLSLRRVDCCEKQCRTIFGSSCSSDPLVSVCSIVGGIG